MTRERPAADERHTRARPGTELMVAVQASPCSGAGRAASVCGFVAIVLARKRHEPRPFVLAFDLEPACRRIVTGDR